MFNISFDFDEQNRKITNIQIIDFDNPIKKRSTKSKDSKPILELVDNKLILSDGLIDLLDAQPEDRIVINYYSINNQETIPLIGKSQAFADKDSGNRLTKSNTVSFRGNKQEVLSEYGQLFAVSPFKTPGQFQLTPIDNALSAEETINNILSEEVNILEQYTEIDEEINKLTEHDLPF